MTASLHRICLLLALTAGSTWAAGPLTIPLDLWIYPALDRLALLGLIPSQSIALRPWTVQEGLRQAAEARRELSAGVLAASPELQAQAENTLDSVERELQRMALSNGIRVDSGYLRMGGISGTPLSDGWHFGQTWTNDWGRPIANGFSSVSGVSGSASYGPFSAYVRGEVQTSSTLDARSPAQEQFLRNLDGLPPEASFPIRGGNRTRVLEGYVGYQFKNLAVTVGKQALWWGPTYDTPLSFSTNAEPTENLRVFTPSPFELPGFLRHLGKIRGEFVIGRLGRHQYARNPWFNAQKLTFKLTPDLELGFTRWSIFWGDGHPRTVESFFRNFFSFTSQPASGLIDPDDPGDRKGGFDFRYRLPGKASFLTVYADSYSEDDPSPLAAPRRAGISGGLFFSRLPIFPASSFLFWQDLRLEFLSTEPLGTSLNLNYYNNQYRTGNTNMGYLLGSWTGRAGRAVSAWTGHTFSARRRLEVGYQHFKVDGGFLPGGGTQNRASVKGYWQVGSDWMVEGYLQGERYWFPALGGVQRTWSSWASISWRPMFCLTGCNSAAFTR